MVEIIRGKPEFAQGKIKIGIEKWRGIVLLCLSFEVEARAPT